jgi:hypothetical protein
LPDASLISGLGFRGLENGSTTVRPFFSGGVRC